MGRLSLRLPFRHISTVLENIKLNYIFLSPVECCPAHRLRRN
ncbi:hypothetical protein VSDKYIMU_CDS0112 [Enterococcus phage VRE9_4]